MEMQDLIAHFTELGNLRTDILNSIEIVKVILESGDLKRGRKPLLLNLELLSKGCLKLSDFLQKEEYKDGNTGFVIILQGENNGIT